MKNQKLATLVTTRSSGSSYLNRVELQNGCLARGHSNTFIPSTLGGSCINPDTGNIDEEKLKDNLGLAITAYISRVSGCKCGESTIQLYEGDQCDDRQAKRDLLNIFLKGSKSARDSLKRSNSQLFSYFQEIWSIRNRHLVQGLPQQYIFF